MSLIDLALEDIAREGYLNIDDLVDTCFCGDDLKELFARDLVEDLLQALLVCWGFSDVLERLSDAVYELSIRYKKEDNKSDFEKNFIMHSIGVSNSPYWMSKDLLKLFLDCDDINYKLTDAVRTSWKEEVNLNRAGI